MTGDSIPTWIDRGPGSGSLTWSEAKTAESSRAGPNDGRSKTQTTFYEEGHDDPTDNKTWSQMAAFNDGVGDPDRNKRNHESDKQRIIEIFADVCGCTDYQRRRVEWIVEDIENIREFYPATPMEHVILAALSLVVDSETTDFENRITKRDSFKRLMDDVGMEKIKDLWSMREKIRQEIDVFDDGI